MSSEAEDFTPPVGEAIWLVAKLGDTPYTAVRAHTWFDARRKGSLALGCGEEHVEVSRMPAGKIE